MLAATVFLSHNHSCLAKLHSKKSCLVDSLWHLQRLQADAIEQPLSWSIASVGILS